MATDRPGRAGEDGVETSSREGSARPPRGSGDGGSGKLWGARAEFVASLGRKIAEARDSMAALEADVTSRSSRDELRRKLHAIGAAARLLRFDAMATALSAADAVLEHASNHGTVTEADFDHLGRLFDDLPALAWNEAPGRSLPPAEPAAESVASTTRLAISALVFGDETIASALSAEDETIDVQAFECERTDDAFAALETARAIGPDVVVIDAEVAGAVDLVESLLDDPLTEPVPIAVLGEFRGGDSQARFIALGVAKVLLKPVTPQDLRRACEELVAHREGHTVRVTLGEPTLEQLGMRLAEEVRHALVDAADRAMLDQRVPLGEGTEILGAVWGAIARVREVVTARTGGAVRFAGVTPEGAIPVAPWLHGDLLGSERGGRAARGPSADVRLDGRRVVVADDDPGVTWFIADLLRAAGCDVHEALDGRTALDLCYRTAPELVISDILMPELDGFALARMLKHDVALRDTPFILLSWKEDLLQRVRELGAGAAAYMRKESDSRAILARVREVLRPRVRVETRLRGEGEVRGRLDGLTVHSLLELVCRTRRSARISVRDAMYLHEIEIREGAPRRATRTAADGSFQRGERVVAAMLGIGAGRFVVAPSSGAIQSDLSGSLAQQLAKPVAAARGALHVVTGQSTVNVHGLAFDDSVLGAYLRATPEPMRSVIERLARGMSPRGMILSGEVAPSLLEDVLADLAAHGAIQAVRSVGGEDLMTPSVEAALAVIEGRKAHKSVPPAAITPRTSKPPTRTVWPKASPSTRDLSALASERPSASMRVARRSPPPPAMSAELQDNGSASSLADAVMRELIDRGTEPPPAVAPAPVAAKAANHPEVAERADGVEESGAPDFDDDDVDPPPTRPYLPDAAPTRPISDATSDVSIPVIDQDLGQGLGGTPSPSRTRADEHDSENDRITAPNEETATNRDAYTDKIILGSELLETPPPVAPSKRDGGSSPLTFFAIALVLGFGTFGAIASVATRGTPERASAHEPTLAATSVQTVATIASERDDESLAAIEKGATDFDGGLRDAAAAPRKLAASTP